MARANMFARDLSNMVDLYTQDAPAAAAVPQRSIGLSTFPYGVVEVNPSAGVVTECCPPVMP